MMIREIATILAALAIAITLILASVDRLDTISEQLYDVDKRLTMLEVVYHGNGSKPPDDTRTR